MRPNILLLAHNFRGPASNLELGAETDRQIGAGQLLDSVVNFILKLSHMQLLLLPPIFYELLCLSLLRTSFSRIVAYVSVMHRFISYITPTKKIFSQVVLRLALDEVPVLKSSACCRL